jgi:hypothetical protein
MMVQIPSFTHLSDSELIAKVRTLAARERDATVALIASLVEFDSRRLYLGEGCSSLFTYCTQVLHLSEHTAYGRIEAARAARRYPGVLERLADGSLTLTAINVLAPHLTVENCATLLEAARHKTKREVEQIVAALPTFDLASCVRPAVVRALAHDLYEIRLTVRGETFRRLCRAQDLMRHTVPNGAPAEIVDRALTLLVEQLERSRTAAVSNPRPARPARRRTRHIPASVRRAVWTRDEGRCAFVGSSGRCSETGFLELHHLEPFSIGGPSTVENLQLRCAAHNRYEGRLSFGSDAVRERPDLASSYVNSCWTE